MCVRDKGSLWLGEICLERSSYVKNDLEKESERTMVINSGLGGYDWRVG